MKIDAIEVNYVTNHMIIPWRTAYGEDADFYSIIVRMHSGAYYGYSEVGPLDAPTYSPEYSYGCYYLVSKIFAPVIVGKDIDSPEQLNDMLSMFKGNSFAKAAIEVAWWMLKARMEGKPLHKLLGGTKTEVDSGTDFGVTENIDELLGNIQNVVSAGFKRTKLKVKPGKDIEVLREVRRAFPKHTFHIDCNSGYTLKDLPLFKEIDKLGLAMIEQPLFHADVVDHAKLQSQIDTPICLDESCNSLHAARQAIELGSCKFINIKPGRVGGLHNAIQIHNMCKDAGIGNWVGGMLESTIAQGIGVELATLDNMVYPSDLFPSGGVCTEEISRNKIVCSSPAKIKASDVPGVPYEPDEEILKRRTQYYERIEA